ncbi:MAG: VPS10 domain-containing protein, partial [Gemmatimonadaceae bacterium]
MYQRSIRIAAALAFALPRMIDAQPPSVRPPRPAQLAPTQPFSVDTMLLNALRWREVGPARGGRSVAVAGSPQRPYEYWMGTTGGGVFKTTDGGMNWQPAGDRYFGGTIGAITVDPSNPDIVWVGGGETCIRGNTSHGDGVWRTDNGGRTWTLMGFSHEHVSDIVVHPTNSNIVYLSVFGDPFKATPNRGIYKSTDAGKNWTKSLFVNDSTGGIDLVFDPSNPEVLYAAMWQAWRQPWGMSSGGAHSAIYKTTDGGANWTNLTTTATGLPKG